MVTARYWHVRRGQWVGVTFQTMEDLEEDMAINGTEYHNIKEKHDND